jgi:glycosyltransferase involved in cell wall biosynthesis
MTMTKQYPKISVCVPVYNGEKYIAQTLASLLEQDYPDFEVIVSDNQSTDGTAEIVRRLAAQNTRLAYTCTPERYGAAEHNFNNCLKLGVGEFIAVYHADDIYYKDMLRKSADALLADASLGAVVTLADKIGSDGKIIGDGSFFYSNSVSDYNLQNAVSDVLRVGCSPFMCSSAMFRRALLAQHGLQWEHNKYRSSSDLGLFLKILRHAGIKLIKERLMGYRISQAQGSTALIRQRTRKGDYFLVLRDYREYIERDAYKGNYCFSVCKDLLVRALNFTYAGEVRKSDRRLKLFFSFFFNRAGLLYTLPKAYMLPLLGYSLLVINHLAPSAKLKRLLAGTLLRLGRTE